MLFSFRDIAFPKLLTIRATCEFYIRKLLAFAFRKHANNDAKEKPYVFKRLSFSLSLTLFFSLNFMRVIGIYL